MHKISIGAPAAHQIQQFASQGKTHCTQRGADASITRKSNGVPHAPLLRSALRLKDYFEYFLLAYLLDDSYYCGSTSD
jgi:hypothetical protein